MSITWNEGEEPEVNEEPGLFDRTKCQKCNNPLKDTTLHSCPYNSDINGDDSCSCNCCDVCTDECAMDI